MIQLDLPLGSREMLVLPGIHAFDELTDEPADPTVLVLLFAVVAADSAEPAEGAYLPGEWLAGPPSPTGGLLVGPGGVFVPPGRGLYDVWAGVNGTRQAPRRKVAQVNVT